MDPNRSNGGNGVRYKYKYHKSVGYKYSKYMFIVTLNHCGRFVGLLTSLMTLLLLCFVFAFVKAIE